MIKENCEDLLNGVVLRAAQDYQLALCRQKKSQREIHELESFFNGDNFKLYTKVDGKKLAEELKNEVVDHHYNIEEMRRIHRKRANG